MKTQMDPISRMLLTGMALNNVDQAARLLRSDEQSLALWHLNEAVKQLGQAQIISTSPGEKAETVIELENASTTRLELPAATMNHDSTKHGCFNEGAA